MQQKTYLLEKQRSRLISPPFSVSNQRYDIFAQLSPFNAGDSCTVIVEGSDDGGTWTTIATFGMSDSTVAEANSVLVTFRVLRARVTSIAGVPTFSTWISEAIA